MQHQQQSNPYHLQSALDRAIDEFANRQQKLAAEGKTKSASQLASEQRHLTAELNYISCIAQVQAGLAKYKSDARSMCDQTIESEQHSSARLGEFLRASGKPKPDDRVDAHAIVAGGHTAAARIRGLMAALKIRVDDPDNGMWMPRRSADTPHWAFPKCPPHSRIHRFNYYFWLRTVLLGLRDEVQFRHALRMVARQLEQGTHPAYVMLRKGEGLPEDDDL